MSFSISLTTYIVTVIFLSALIFVVMVFTKRPQGNKPQYLTIDELEKTGWELVDQIREVGEEYAEKITHAKGQVDTRIEKLNEIEHRLEQYSNYEELMDKRQAMLEDLYTQVKNEADSVREFKMIEQKIQESAKQVNKKPMEEETEEVKEEVVMEEGILEEELEIEVMDKKEEFKKDLNSIEDKKVEVYRLHGEGYSLEDISKLTGTHKGFVEVLLNMSKMKKNG